jgi:hypothetical protein
MIQMAVHQPAGANARSVAKSRTCSINRSATGWSARFLKVMIDKGQGQTASSIGDRIAKEVERLVTDPASAERLEQNGVDRLGNTPREFAAMIAEDAAFRAQALTAVGLRPK